MDLKDMILTVVYQSPDGLVPLKIVEEIARQYETETNTRQILRIVEKNPSLFKEVSGKIKSAAPYTIG